MSVWDKAERDWWIEVSLLKVPSVEDGFLEFCEEVGARPTADDCAIHSGTGERIYAGETHLILHDGVVVSVGHGYRFDPKTRKAHDD